MIGILLEQHVSSISKNLNFMWQRSKFPSLGILLNLAIPNSASNSRNQFLDSANSLGSSCSTYLSKASIMLMFTTDYLHFHVRLHSYLRLSVPVSYRSAANSPIQFLYTFFDRCFHTLLNRLPYFWHRQQVQRFGHDVPIFFRDKHGIVSSPQLSLPFLRT